MALCRISWGKGQKEFYSVTPLGRSPSLIAHNGTKFVSCTLTRVTALLRLGINCGLSFRGFPVDWLLSQRFFGRACVAHFDLTSRCRYRIHAPVKTPFREAGGCCGGLPRCQRRYGCVGKELNKRTLKFGFSVRQWGCADTSVYFHTNFETPVPGGRYYADVKTA